MIKFITVTVNKYKPYIIIGSLFLLLGIGLIVVLRFGGGFSIVKEYINPENEEVFLQDPDPDDNWSLERGEEFFVEYRLERERIRSREIDILQALINNPNSTPESKREAEQKLMQIQRIMEQELAVENSLVAMGYKHAILFYQNGNANIVVNAEALTREEKARIAEIVSKIIGVERYQVFITEKGN
ncbi:SpoIIIAH-like family protein [Anaerobranca gottschalkii]|uniref:Stage III sporulation protein AH n=1 Tax=Anaerobranca gottschalkii DSM 13577 TaxID=1120990 RepID=A0A1H9Y2F5_9FIRM|nr:SpoIIIAH-like family protein [Anaerobranca gottschalkii]SES62909.1 stage III sporulation protein AH [Anaerobranca gottschalkii DSM 13577]